MGGNYDSLFLETPQASLSFIYQSLGCFHTLQPERDPYSAPSTPALTPQGFVRWQTVQLLLEPDEHVPFLQEAVKRFDITNPADGIPFPSLLPRETLPSKPDQEMVQWHEGVAEKLMIESQAWQARDNPGGKFSEISDGTTESSMTSSVDDQSLVDAATYFHDSRTRPSFRPPPSINLPRSLKDMPADHSRKSPPWLPERRRSSTSDLRSPKTSSWPHDSANTPTAHVNHNAFRHSRQRNLSTTSTSSTSSTSSSSSLTASSVSMSPTLQSHRQDHGPSRPRYHQRRHSSSYASRENHSSSVAPIHPLATDYFSRQQPPRQPNGNSRGLNVRWPDTGPQEALPRRPPEARDGRLDPRLVERRADYEEQLRGGRYGGGGGSSGRGRTAPLRGVGGRRYAPDIMNSQ